MEIQKEKNALDTIFYLLLGFDTPNVYMEDPYTLKVTHFDETLIQPFEYLMLKIREFSITAKFVPFVASYFRRLEEFRTRIKTVEELFVQLQGDIEMFRNLEKIKNKNLLSFICDGNLNVCNSSVCNNNDLLMGDKIRAEMFEGINSEVFAYFYGEFIKKLEEEILDWVNYARAGQMITVSSADSFGACFWDNAFNFDCEFISSESRTDILECGKMIYFCREVYETDITTNFSDGDNNNIHDDEQNAKVQVLSNETLKAQNLKAHNLKAHNLEAHNLKVHNLKAHKLKLRRKFNALLSSSIKEEFAVFYDVMLLRNFGFYSEIFEEFNKQLLEDDVSIFSAVNSYSKMHSAKNFRCLNFCLSESSFNAYILKLLKSQKMPALNVFCPLYEKIYVDCNFDILRYFLSPRCFTELGILHRFLVMVFYLSFSLERVGVKFKFSRAMYLILHRIQEIPVVWHDSGSIDQSIGFIDQSVGFLKAQIKELLNAFNLTNTSIYENWSVFFSFCSEFMQVEYKENLDEKEMNRRLREILVNLDSIICRYGDNEMTDLIKQVLIYLEEKY